MEDLLFELFKQNDKDYLVAGDFLAVCKCASDIH